MMIVLNIEGPKYRGRKKKEGLLGVWFFLQKRNPAKNNKVRRKSQTHS